VLHLAVERPGVDRLHELAAALAGWARKRSASRSSNRMEVEHDEVGIVLGNGAAHVLPAGDLDNFLRRVSAWRPVPPGTQ
jgi:hypothetical protein